MGGGNVNCKLFKKILQLDFFLFMDNKEIIINHQFISFYWILFFFVNVCSSLEEFSPFPNEEER